MSGDNFPYVPPALVTALEKQFPPKNPSLKDSERKIFFEAGKVELVRWLRARSEQQGGGQDITLEM